MPIRLQDPEAKKLLLELDTELDPEQDTWVEVNKATQGEVLKRAALTEDASRIFRQGAAEIEVKQKWNVEEQKRLEVFLTLAGSNIEGADGKALFKFKREHGKMVLAMTADEFNGVWGTLPEEIAEAIHDKVLEVNPNWNPNWKG